MRNAIAGNAVEYEAPNGRTGDFRKLLFFSVIGFPWGYRTYPTRIATDGESVILLRLVLQLLLVLAAACVLSATNSTSVDPVTDLAVTRIVQ